MTNQSSSRIRRVYGILLSVVLVIAGLCLMAQCYGIYTSAEGTFSREIVAQYFGPIAIPVWLCMAMVILGFVLDVFLPAGKEKGAVEKNYQLILERLHAKTDLVQCEESLRASVLREQSSRKRHKIVTIALLVLGSIIFLSYALNGSSFHQHEINASMIQAMLRLLPCMLVPFGYAVFAAYHSRASIRREIDLMKQANAPRKAPAEQAKPVSNAPVILRWAVLAVAVGILVYGYCAGGTADVLTKAINICTECVGLG